MAKTQLTDPEIAARRARVAAMRGTMSNRAIAAALGVGESTVRRDLAALDAERATLAAAHATTRATIPQQPTTQRATTPRHDAPQRHRLELDLDDDLAAALRTLVSFVPGARHTPATYRAAARAAIRAMADSMREAHGPDLAAAAPSGRAAAPRA